MPTLPPTSCQLCLICGFKEKHHCPLHLPGLRRWISDQTRVLEELDEDLVDKLVLGDGLHHQHPLLPQL